MRDELFYYFLSGYIASCIVAFAAGFLTHMFFF